MNRTVLTSFTILCLLSTVFLIGLAFNIQLVNASGTIYIRADGSVDPPTANIISADNITYYFTDNIYDSIVVQRDNIVVDGTGYTLQGTNYGVGVELNGENNITITNMEIKAFELGISLYESSKCISISGNNITNNGDGIHLYESFNNKITGNKITKSELGIWLIGSHNNRIAGNSITKNEHGVHLTESFYFPGSSNNGICGNNIANNDYGIYLAGSSDNNSIVENNITGNELDGIHSSTSSNNRMVRNNITNNGLGIRLWLSCTNTISGNNVTNNDDGIHLTGDSDSNEFCHNNFIDNTHQVYVNTSGWGPGHNFLDDGYPSGGNYWSDHTCVGNPSNGSQPYIIDKNNIDHYPFQDPNGWLKVHNVDTRLNYETIQEAIDANETLDGHTIFVEAGIYCEHVVVNKSLSLIGENRSTTIVDGGATGSVVTVTRDNVNIIGFTIQESGSAIPDVGVKLDNVTYCEISGNNIANNDGEGIEVLGSNNDLSGNNIINNDNGIIFAFSSKYNVVSGNNITDNSGYGIRLSNYNAIFGNNLRNNGGGIFIGWSSNNTVSGNNVIENDWAGIWLFSSSNNTISANNIAETNGPGIELRESSNNNSISGNDIANNDYGIRLSALTRASSNNIIYHNNFVDNSEQVYSDDSTNVWDNGYPSGGNYWSDYNGTDLYSGPHQNEAGYDWIGDSSYIINENNQDNYPLMHPFVPEREEIRIAYRNLLLKYSELLSDFETLNSTLYILLSNITDLQRRYDSLLTTINDMQEQINSLNSTCKDLQDQIDSLNSTLTSRQEAIIDELANIRNVMYVFIATTVILIATAVYIAVRKPKIKR